MYYVLFLIGFIGSIKKNNKLFLIIFTISLILIASFRFGVGRDYFAYELYYNSIDTNIIKELTEPIFGVEILYRMSSYLFRKLNFSYELYLSFLSIIGIYFVYSLVKRFSLNSNLSIFLFYSFFYFVWIFSGIRQGLAITIGIYYFVRLLNEKDGKKFVIINILLMLIHTSAIVLTPIYLIVKRVNLKSSNLIILSSISLLTTFLPIGQVIKSLDFLPLLNIATHYIPTEFNFLSIFDFQSIVRLIFLAFGLLIYSNKRLSLLEKKIVLSFVLFLNIYFYLQFSEILASRLSIYGFYLIILIIPMYFYKISVPKESIIIGLVFMILSFSYMQKDLVSMSIGTINNQDSFFVPYTNHFNKNEYSFIRENYFK